LPDFRLIGWIKTMFPPLPYPGGSRRFGFYRAAARQRRLPAFLDDFSATSDAAPSGSVKQLQVPHGALGRAGTFFALPSPAWAPDLVACVGDWKLDTESHGRPSPPRSGEPHRLSGLEETFYSRSETFYRGISFTDESTFFCIKKVFPFAQTSVSFWG
jgi:hypothetical protein